MKLNFQMVRKTFFWVMTKARIMYGFGGWALRYGQKQGQIKKEAWNLKGIIIG